MNTSKTRRTLRGLRKATRSYVTNVYGTAVVREWYRLDWGDLNYDLHPTSLGEQPLWKQREQAAYAQIEEQKLSLEDSVAAQMNLPRYQPEGWPWWLDELDLEEALGLGVSGVEVVELGRSWRERWRPWALENGVAPGQPFCVAHQEPEVSKSGWETVEYDVYYDSYLVEVAPIPQAELVRRWEHDQRRTTIARALHVAQAAKNAVRINQELGQLYIQQSLYSSERGYSVPRGRALTLRSKLYDMWPCDRCVEGVEGRDDKGDFDNAMHRLIENACAVNPRLSPDIIRNLELKK